MPKKAARFAWRTYQYNHKTRKKTRIALIALASLIVLLIISQLINLVNLVSNPLRSKDTRKYTWNGEFNLNIAFRTSPLRVASYNPQEKQVTIIKIPDTTFIEVPSGFGKWQISSVYSLGGDRLLKDSLSSFMGIPIDAVVSEDLVTHLRKSLISGLELLPTLQTDLTLLELLRLKVGFLQIRFDKIKEIDLLDLDVLDQENLADGTEVFISDPVKLDSYLADFQDPMIRLENLTVAVFNATDKPQLALKVKRLITNLGGNVIAVQNAPRNLEKSYVEGDKSKTLNRLSQIFDQNCNLECDKITRQDLGLVSERAQIIVVLGQDF